MLKFGDKVISSLYFSDKKISKVYMGSKLIYKEKEPIFLDYIKSTGTQWIDTGIEATSITRFVIQGTCDTKGSQNTQLLGTNSNNASTFFGARYYSNTGVKSWYCRDAEGVSIGNPTNLSIIDCTIESRSSQYGTLTDLVDGSVNEFASFTDDWGFTSGNLLLFGGESTRVSPDATCYSLQLYTADGLVRDLRPCLHPITFKVCMYDIVTKRYFYNKGSNTLIAGNKINFVDYIIFDGNSWIDVDYAPTSNTRVVGKVSFTQWHPTAGANYVFGVYGDNANFGFNVGSTRVVMNVPWGTSAGVTFNNDNTFGQVYSFDISKNGAYLDGVLKLKASQLSAEFTATKSFYVGWSNGTSTQKLIGNIYPMQIYENDILEKDLKPCIINGVAGLYDMVTCKFHTNIGTGTLKASGRFVESIIFDGASYIDTGIIPLNNMEFEADVMFSTVQSTNLSIIASRDGDKRYQPIGAIQNKWSSSIGGTYDEKGSPVFANIRYKLRSVVSNGDSVSLYSSDTLVSSATSSGGIPTKSLYLFARNYSPIDSYVTGIFYNSKVWGEGTLIQDLRPYLDEDEIPCLYDLVTNVKFYNKGSGTLSYTE